MKRLRSGTRGMDHAPARGGDSRRPHWWVGIGGRRALLLLRACWWYGQRKRLVQVQAKVVAGPGGGGVTCYYIRTFLHTTTFSPSALSLPFPALEGGCLSRAYAEQQESCCCWRELHWLTRRAKANTLPTSRLLPARERRARLTPGTHALLLEVQSRLQVALLLPGAAAEQPAAHAAASG